MHTGTQPPAPDDGTAAYRSGITALRQGRLAEAIALLEQSVMQQPVAIAYGNLGLALWRAGRVAEAAAAFRRLIALDPSIALAWNDLGRSLARMGQRDAAEASYRRALSIVPAFAEASLALALSLTQAERWHDALQQYRAYLGLQPFSAAGHQGLAKVLMSLGRRSEAFAAYRTALCCDPAAVETLADFGAALRGTGWLAGAANLLQRVVCCQPQRSVAHIDLGLALHELGRIDEAVAAMTRAAATLPGDPRFSWLRCVMLPRNAYGNEVEIEETRRAYAEALASLEKRLAASPSERQRLVSVAGIMQPFFLPYQGRCDRDLQRAYGHIVTGIMAASGFAPPPPLPRRRDGGPIRVGIVSGFFYQHSVWKIIARGWMNDLDPARFQLFGYYTGSTRDSHTEEAARLCIRFVEGACSLRDWVGLIAGDQLDVVIFPEIGMDPVTAQIAAFRLAPVQCMSWGHPNTSGYASIDYFLSSDLMEPPGAEAHYTETLVRLPNLSFSYLPLDCSPAPLTRAEIGLAEDDVFFWCCQVLYKYLPATDVLFPRIAARLPKARFVFLDDASAVVNETFRLRLERAFADHGLEAGRYCLFLPRQSAERFAALCRMADVYLDSIGWSGGNTTMETLAYGTPVVTLPGELMRGRHSAAILQQLGLTQTIAADIDDYVDLAVAFGGDAERREAWRHDALARLGRLYHDLAPVRALEAFLEAVTAA
jgi:predicted O-linked N-acetylglucosamine transferase (SPINDLY family)